MDTSQERYIEQAFAALDILLWVSLLAASSIWFYNNRSQSRRAAIPGQRASSNVNHTATQGSGFRQSIRSVLPQREVKVEPPFVPTVAAKFITPNDATPHLNLILELCSTKPMLDDTVQNNLAELERLGDSSIATPITVDASFHAKFASSSRNMQVFANGLQSLWNAATVRRCYDVTVKLPIDGAVTRDDVGLPPATHTLLPAELKSLFWRGHLNQMNLFFTRPFTHLAALTLHCELSKLDCARIMYLGKETFRSLEIHTIIKDDRAHDPTFSFPVPHDDEPFPMPSLESLTITSAYNIAQMLGWFSFPSVREVDFVISDLQPDILDCFETFTTDNIQKSHLHCYMAHKDCQWIRENFAPDAVIDFNRDGRTANVSLPM